MNQANVYLIGAGPGDEGLISVKAVEVLKQVDVVIYDKLVNVKLLDYCKPTCEQIFVGKQASNHTKPQEEINQLLVEKAQAGKQVARLKGGDPFIFGRGGEEALELVKNNILFEIIPGITAGVAAAAYAGISVTQRGYTSTVSFITGHEDPTKNESDIDWSKISTGVGTLIFYMGVKNLPLIVEKLIENGRSKETPVAVIRYGTYNKQQTLTSTLKDVTADVKKQNIQPPSIIIVGEVVSLREQLRWFDKRPLFGKKIVVTRSRTQISELSNRLKSLGADVIEFSTIDIQPAEDFSKLYQTFKEMNQYNWIVFTSTNAVDIFFSQLFKQGYDSRLLSESKIAVIGSETGKRLYQFGIKPDLTPLRYTSEGTIEAFKQISTDFTGQKILIPSSEIARDYIPMELQKMGAEITSIPIYKNTLPEYSAEKINEIVGDDIDLFTFSSSSTVNNLVEILIAHGHVDKVKEIKGASIGPITSATAKKLNLPIVINANTHTIFALTEAIQEFF